MFRTYVGKRTEDGSILVTVVGASQPTTFVATEQDIALNVLQDWLHLSRMVANALREAAFKREVLLPRLLRPVWTLHELEIQDWIRFRVAERRIPATVTRYG